MKGDAASAKALAEEELGITDEEISTLSYDEATASPRIKETAGLMRFWWDVEQVQIDVARLHCHRDGRVTGEVKVTTTAPGYRNHLHHAQLNFVATRSKRELAKHLQDCMNSLDWQTIVENLSYNVMDRARQGEPIIDLWSDADIPQPDYCLFPLLPEAQPTVLYGLGGSGKSMLAILFAVCAQLPWHDNPFGLKVAKRTPVLYLDWEANSVDINWRLKSLQNGLGFPTLFIPYRRGSLPLADDTERIQQVVLDKDIGLVIVDSVAAACGGNLNDAEPAIRMFTALRQLKVGSLLIAHTPKNSVGQETTIFGSAFFNFYARSVWEVRKVQETDENHISVGLYHKKANNSKLFRPLGFRIEYDESANAATVRTEELATVSELAKHLAIKSRIYHALLQKGRMTIEQLASELETTEATVKTKLYLLKKHGDVEKYDKFWGILHKGPEN